MEPLVALCHMRGDFTVPGSDVRVRELKPGAPFLADADNARRLIRKRAAEPAPVKRAAKKKKAKPAEEV